MKVKRIESTPQQIEEAILAGPHIDPCRFVYALEAYPELDHVENWARAVPVHAVIHALRKDAETYGDLLRAERSRREAAEARHQQLLDALGVVGQALGVLAVEP